MNAILIDIEKMIRAGGSKTIMSTSHFSNILQQAMALEPEEQARLLIELTAVVHTHEDVAEEITKDRHPLEDPAKLAMDFWPPEDHLDEFSKTIDQLREQKVVPGSRTYESSRRRYGCSFVCS